MHDVESALDESNYNMSLPPANVETCVGHNGPKTDKNAEQIEFITAWPQQAGRQGAGNVINDNPMTLKTAEAKSANTPLLALFLFITMEMLNIILKSTNAKIEEHLASLPAEKVNNFYKKTKTYLYK